MGEFQTGLFGCFSNFSLCCAANTLLPLTVGTIAKDIEMKQPVLWPMTLGAGPCLLGLLRTRMRQKHGIAGSNTGDCCASMLCGPCVVTQMAVQSQLTMDTVLPNEQDMNRVADQTN